MTCLICGKYECYHTPEERGDTLFVNAVNEGVQRIKTGERRGSQDKKEH